MFRKDDNVVTKFIGIFFILTGSIRVTLNVRWYIASKYVNIDF